MPGHQITATRRFTKRKRRKVRIKDNLGKPVVLTYQKPGHDAREANLVPTVPGVCSPQARALHSMGWICGQKTTSNTNTWRHVGRLFLWMFLLGMRCIWCSLRLNTRQMNGLWGNCLRPALGGFFCCFRLFMCFTGKFYEIVIPVLFLKDALHPSFGKLFPWKHSPNINTPGFTGFFAINRSSEQIMLQSTEWHLPSSCFCRKMALRFRWQDADQAAEWKHEELHRVPLPWDTTGTFQSNKHILIFILEIWKIIIFHHPQPHTYTKVSFL